jgi:signal transduction histidine kinase
MGVELEAGADGNHRIVGNRELIGQALSNIVDNAIKYSAGSCLKPVVTVKAEKVDGEIRLTVADNGPGIPKDDHDRATERFVRLEQSRSQPGSGLGLSLSKAVMKFHGGRFVLSSRDPGLEVSMIFPVSKEAA